MNGVFKTKRKSQMKIGILITSYNNIKDQDRIAMYQDVISWWINETPYTIFVTNSGGTKFNDYIEKNAYTYTFSQDDYAGNGNDTKSYFEALSVDKCFNHYKKELLMFDIIFKVTGKYKVILDEVLPENLDVYDIVRQNNITRDKINGCKTSSYWVPTELIGFKPKLLLENFYKMSNKNQGIERNTYDFLYKNSKKYKIYTLPCVKNLAKWDKFPGTGPLKEIYKITYNSVLNAYKKREKFKC